jgi:hypothetical protein
MEDLPQAQFNGWARVEVMGHQTHIGFVRTEAYGSAVLFRVDTPELPAREYILQEPEYVGGKWAPAGTKVERAAVLGCSVLIGAGSIYRIAPCTEQAALAAIERSGRTELKLIELPPEKALAAAEDASRDYIPYEADDEEDDEADGPL